MALDMLLEFSREGRSSTILTKKMTPNKGRCTNDGCTNNITRIQLEYENDMCKKCSIRCNVCHYIRSKNDYDEGYFKGTCIDCRRCEYCQKVMWDAACGNCDV